MGTNAYNQRFADYQTLRLTSRPGLEHSTKDLSGATGTPRLLVDENINPGNTHLGDPQIRSSAPMRMGQCSCLVSGCVCSAPVVSRACRQHVYVTSWLLSDSETGSGERAAQALNLKQGKVIATRLGRPRRLAHLGAVSRDRIGKRKAQTRIHRASSSPFRLFSSRHSVDSILTVHSRPMMKVEVTGSLQDSLLAVFRRVLISWNATRAKVGQRSYKRSTETLAQNPTSGH